ncbi:MAG: PD-(D/E)XK nuclease family protein [Bacteroidales bacterium]|nr:PD-(D/E)XK nuclease family protein [Bacteroidales bacterium]
MNEFLRQVADCYYKEFGKRVAECCFVFPNRRSALFFRKYLGECASGPILSPRLMSINDLFSELSGLETVGKIPALDMLYRRYASLMWPGVEPKETFDDFVFWGDTLLNDFEDVDKYLVDARLLFANISELNEIDAGYSFLTPAQIDAIRQFWGSFLKEGAPVEEGRLDKKAEFRTVWSILFELYSGFRDDLKAQGKGYEGMIYREVAERLKETGAGLEDSLARIRGFRRIVFVGLNALNECEKVLLDTLKKECEADFYWDYYGKMVTDGNNKSSIFLRENVERYPSRHSIDPALAATQTFRSIAVPSAVGQTRLACSLLEEIADKQGFIKEETAVVLPDENLLLPMLGAIPECVADVNVTMGFPLSASNVATFLKMLDRLHRNRRVRNGACQFYHRDVIAMLTHPFVHKGISELADGIVARIRKDNIVYSPEETFAGDGLLAAIFRRVDDAEALPDYLHSIIGILQDKLDGIDKEFIYSLEKCLNSLTSYGLEIRTDTFFKLLGRLAEVIRVQFSGEPLKGLQIMGPLETRALDFRNVIILSANEGTFPGRGVSASFIPYNLRRGFGLPTYEFQDAISAYHFYRSICRAENVVFIRDSRTEGLSSGEESRYVKQLKYLYGVEVKEATASYDIAGSDILDSPRPVEKTPEIMRLLEEKYIQGNGHFSATSLNNYFQCKLKFYYANVLGISEADEVTEELDGRMLGIIFHRSMEVLYLPFVGRDVSAADINAIKADGELLGRTVDDAFRSECKINEISGHKLIVRNLVLRFIDKVLEVDARKAPFKLNGVESKRTVSFDLDDNGRKVSLFGKIDRIDSFAGRTQIIDYKTGSVETGQLDKSVFKKVQNMFDQNHPDKRPYIAFQLYFYLFLVLNGEISDACENYSTSVYSLRDLFSRDPSDKPEVSSDYLLEFKDRLRLLINEIFNPEVPFSPCEKPQYGGCMCVFKELCNRWQD